MIRFAASFLAVFAAAAVAGCSRDAPPSGDAARDAREVRAADAAGGAISADNLAGHLRILASDEFEGRAPDTPGEEKTVAYIGEQFAAAGLEPAGDDGGWTQAVTLERSEIRGAVAASFRVAGDVRTLANGEEIALETLHPAGGVDMKDVPLVFAGYGITAPELDWDDYAGLDVAGKIVVVLVNDPDFETSTGRFGGRAMTWYGRWAYKYLEAARRGAAGVLIVHETEPAAYPWATVRNGRAAPQFDIVRDDADRHHLRVRGWIQRPVAERLFADAGLDFEQAKGAAQQPGFRAHALGDASFSTKFDVARSRITSRNVLGLLPGSGRADETVIVSGHWDSFGIGQPDDSGDAIINGAVDNATAIASMLEIARVLKTGPAPSRSVLFAALTAEESGLLGATHYAANPVRPLETTAAAINMEMWSPDGPTRDISSWGLGKVSLERELEAAAVAEGRVYSPDPDLEAGFFYRADHFAFAQAGVPAITVGPGMDQLEGGVEGGKAARARYFAERYHQPDDEFDDGWDMRGPTADTEVVLRLVRTIADSGEWPVWDRDSEFRALRGESARARTRIR
ncbi:M28 family peptidase [Luteimonas sp. SJ-92]|uniref:M28 family peptidase n=1 Tax=Luteimonas salinisoli TaxID=2752307 RepID=A0A853JBF7_9GAMM|nr:M28 family metallopeptidase [Luteimonas salinisoli]NZA26175.1 M28 family peptidase [Luteimonas salinisoli]